MVRSAESLHENAFAVFAFLKGKNLSIKGRSSRKSFLLGEWNRLSETDRSEYESIATRFHITIQKPVDLKPHKARLKQIHQVAKAFLHTLVTVPFGIPTSDASLPLEGVFVCLICRCDFDTLERSPIVLPCGHTVCQTCIEHQWNAGSHTCPFDRSSLQSEFAVNWTIFEWVGSEMNVARCATHKEEAVAYCPMDGSLLCGLCISTHETHSPVLLDSIDTMPLIHSKIQELSCVLTRAEQVSQCLGKMEAELSAVANTQDFRTIRTIVTEVKDTLGVCLKELSKLKKRAALFIWSMPILASWQQVMLTVPKLPSEEDWQVQVVDAAQQVIEQLYSERNLSSD